MVTWLVTQGTAGKHQWGLLQQEQPASSALLALGLVWSHLQPESKRGQI